MERSEIHVDAVIWVMPTWTAWHSATRSLASPSELATHLEPRIEPHARSTLPYEIPPYKSERVLWTSAARATIEAHHTQAMT